MEYNEGFKNKKWKIKTEIEYFHFLKCDFSNTDFNFPIFKKCIFEDCLFNRSQLEDARVYGCSFISCKFMKVDLRTFTFGAHKGIFKGCIFDSCDFRNACFYEPEFEECLFVNNKLKSIDFKASSFSACKFIGKLSDVLFRGYYTDDLTPSAKPNKMSNIDFSEAILGKYVDFENCNLSTCIPPQGTTFEELLLSSKYYPHRLGTGGEEESK